MFNRDISRRLFRLEADRHGGSIRYTVSSRVLSDDEWKQGSNIASADDGELERFPIRLHHTLRR